MFGKGYGAMFNPKRKVAFVVASTDHGTMIINRFDYELVEQGRGAIGVGFDLLRYSSYDDGQLELLVKLLEMRREASGDGVVVIDGGANIGAYTLLFARMMTGWGSVLAFEPQERVFYALCGNIAINNCFNAKAMNAGLGKANGVTAIERIDYTVPRNLGGVHLNQKIEGPTDEVSLCTVDSFGLQRLDLLKLDIEGMEIEALEGAQDTIKKCKPIICAEHIICGLEALQQVLGRLGYNVQMTEMNVVAIHEDDPVSKHVHWHDSRMAAE